MGVVRRFALPRLSFVVVLGYYPEADGRSSE